MLNWILSKRIVIIFLCLIIICVCLPVMLYANAKRSELIELVQHNADDSMLLLVEMEHEAGDDYIEAKKGYEYLLVKFREYMEEKDYSLLLKVLYPELSPKRQLTSMLDILKKSKDSQAKKSIDEAAKIIRQWNDPRKLYH